MMQVPSEELNVSTIRAQLCKMSDEQLAAYAREAAYMASPVTSYGPPRETYRVQLAEARAEWRRRQLVAQLAQLKTTLRKNRTSRLLVEEHSDRDETPPFLVTPFRRPSGHQRMVRSSHSVEKHQDGIWIIDIDGETVYANERMAEILGTTPAEMIGHPSFTYVFPEDVPAAQRLFDAKKQGDLNPFHFKLRRKDNSAVSVDVQGTPLRNAAGQFNGIVGTFSISN
jgi:PAS domain S-box-containing protein